MEDDLYLARGKAFLAAPDKDQNDCRREQQRRRYEFTKDEADDQKQTQEGKRKNVQV